METETSVIILHKLLALASARQQPFIVLENPKRQLDSAACPWIATIGNAAAAFDSFYPGDMVDVYASLKSQLAVEESNAKGN